MSKQTNSTAVIVLAAGDGTRMKSDLPKVMHPLHGTPMIGHVVSHIEDANVTEKPLIIVSAKHTLVQDYLKDRAQYAVQLQQLGTGHAVRVAKDELEGKSDTVVVLYGDMPQLQPDSIKKLVDTHTASDAVITFGTTTVKDFFGPRAAFLSFGRIVRDTQGNLIKSVEYKDATDEEREIRELNTCVYCFSAKWLWNYIDELKNSNEQKEYYLPDLLELALLQKNRVQTVDLLPEESIGINSQDDLQSIQ